MLCSRDLSYRYARSSRGTPPSNSNVVSGYLIIAIPLSYVLVSCFSLPSNMNSDTDWEVRAPPSRKMRAAGSSFSQKVTVNKSSSMARAQRQQTYSLCSRKGNVEPNRLRNSRQHLDHLREAVCFRQYWCGCVVKSECPS
jgi:hypothetical protein